MKHLSCGTLDVSHFVVVVATHILPHQPRNLRALLNHISGQRNEHTHTHINIHIQTHASGQMTTDFGIDRKSAKAMKMITFAWNRHELC